MSLQVRGPRERGVTLFELLVVVAIIAVMATVYGVQNGAGKQPYAGTAAAEILRSAVDRARSDALTQGGATLYVAPLATQDGDVIAVFDAALTTTPPATPDPAPTPVQNDTFRRGGFNGIRVKGSDGSVSDTFQIVFRPDGSVAQMSSSTGSINCSGQFALLVRMGTSSALQDDVYPVSCTLPVVALPAATTAPAS